MPVADGRIPSILDEGKCMNIVIKAINRDKYFDISVDEDNGTCLIGIPFDHGPAGHTNYYAISKSEFDLGIRNPSNLDHLVDGQNFQGSGKLYYSTFVGMGG
jgi:hypothetical protein